MEDSPTLSGSKSRRRANFGKFRFVLKLMGMSLGRNESAAYKVYSFVLIFISLFSYSLIRVLDLLLMNDTTNFYERVLYPFCTVFIFLKSMIFLRIRPKLAKLLDKLEQEPYLPNPKRGNELEEKNLQENCMKIINKQSIIYVGGTIVFITVLATISLIKRIISNNYHDWVFPLKQVTLVNITRSPNYELWWLYESFCMYILSIHCVIIDAVVATILTYVTFQFKMLQCNIQRIVELSYNEMLQESGNFLNADETFVVDGSMIPWKYLKKSLSLTINYHTAILNVVDEIEEVLNGFMLFLFLNTLGLMAVFAGHTNLISRMGMFVLCGQLLASCFWGEQLIHESQEVGRAAYDANFVGADVRFQKSLTLIIRRSQNPVALTAGKFTVVGLSSFTWILRGGYSASTVLSQLK